MPDAALFTIAPGSTEPIYRQLMAQVRRCVAGGQLRAGDEMPSVRELAQSLAVNPMTISKAFSLLEAEGVLERRRGLAMVIAADRSKARPVAERLALLKPSLDRAAREAHELQLAPAQALSLFRTVLDEHDASSSSR